MRLDPTGTNVSMPPLVPPLLKPSQKKLVHAALLPHAPPLPPAETSATASCSTDMKQAPNVKQASKIPGAPLSRFANPKCFNPKSTKEFAATWMSSTPSWRDHQLDLQVYNIMTIKDRALPMTAAARSPRHLQQRSKRFLPPPERKVTAQSKVRKKDLESGVVVARAPISPMRRLINWINRTVDAVMSGFLEQELEVQLVVLFFVVSGGVSAYEFLVALFEREEDKYDYGYAPGHAPPAPPDFPGWQVTLKDAGMAWSLAHPIMYLLINFGSATIIGVIYLFWADIQRWKRRRAMRSRGYGPLSEQKRSGWQKLRDRILNAGKMSQIIKGWRKAATLEDYQSPRTQVRGLVDPDGGPGPPIETAADVRKERQREAHLVEELGIKASPSHPALHAPPFTPRPSHPALSPHPFTHLALTLNRTPDPEPSILSQPIRSRSSSCGTRCTRPSHFSRSRLIRPSYRSGSIGTHAVRRCSTARCGTWYEKGLATPVAVATAAAAAAAATAAAEEEEDWRA